MTDRKSEACTNLLSKTNRQFYVRRKKEPDDIACFHIGKVLKSLIKKNQRSGYSKARQVTMPTQKRQQQQSSKTNDRVFQLIESKRILQPNLKKVNAGWIKLLKSFEKCINSETFEQIQLNQLDFYEVFNQIAVAELQKNKIQNNNSQIQHKNRLGKQNALIIQNMKLEKQNVLLRKQMSSQNGQINKQSINDQFMRERQAKYMQQMKAMGVKSGTHHNNQQFVTNLVMLERKLQVKSQQLQIIKRQVEGLKQQIFLLREEKKSLKERISELKIKNENLCSQVITIQLKNKKMGVSDDKRQAIILMQFQEIESYRRQMDDLKKLFINLNKKYKGLIIKFKKTTSDNTNKIGSMYNRQVEMFPQQFQAFEEVRSIMHNSIRFHLNSHSRDKKLDKTVIYQQYFGSKQTMNNKEGVKKTYNIGSQYYYPSFYGLISQDINFFGIDPNNFEHFNQSIKLNFVGTLRAIMDSKFNQFIFTKQGLRTSSFPSFVLAWLNTFQINQHKKIQQINSTSISTRQTVCTFYANLMSEKLNYSWEVIAFREFLLQTFNNDELFFYLNLRYFLIGGDIVRDLSYCFQQIYCIDFAKALTALNKVIKQNDVETKKIYQQFLKRSIIYVRKKSYLDLHYVLRLMLQYYQNLKQKQIDKILKTIDMITQGRKNHMTLADFQKIFDYHFEFLSFTEVIQLYRKCFCVGNGIISTDVIITILTQQNIFLKWVQTYSANQPITIEQVKDADWDNNFIITPNINWLYENQQKFKFIFNSQLTRQSQLLGIQTLAKNIRRFARLDSNSIYQRLELCFSICMMFSRKFYLSGITSTQKLQEVLDLTAEFLTNLSKVTLRKSQIYQLMADLKYQAASSKIVRFYHRKKAEMTRSILYAYSANIMNSQKDQKNSALRSEFMQIIQQAKQKKSGFSRKTLDQI